MSELVATATATATARFLKHHVLWYRTLLATAVAANLDIALA